MNKPPAKGGHPFKHGGYALVNRETILKEHPVIRRYLDDRRGQLVQDMGGEEALSGAQRILIDRTISLLSRTILIEYFYRADLVLPPGIIPFFVSLNNSIRLSLVALGIDKRAGEKILSPLEIAAEIDAEAARDAQASAARAVAASADGPACPGKGGDEDESGISRGECEKRRARKPQDERSPEGGSQGAVEEAKART